MSRFYNIILINISIYFVRLIELASQCEAAPLSAASNSVNPEGTAAFRVSMKNFGDVNLVSVPIIHMVTMTSYGQKVG